jgi:hypothetical protein
MLIHPWDAAISDTEWRDWLAGHDFGQLAVSDPSSRIFSRKAITPKSPRTWLPMAGCSGIRP